MILDSITLHNFGLYAGHQTVKLTPPSRGRPIVLFGGMNGGGKTTFLDALQLCFFGAHAKTSSRGSAAYRDYLANSIFRAAARPEASIEISFRHIAEGNEDKYTLRRSWSRVNGRCKEVFLVQKNGRREDLVAENWASQVDDFLPANIAHLFLFDGEQIERYASADESCSLIGSGVQALLGLDMVDQLEQDLKVYERRKRTESRDDGTRLAIEAVERELRDLQSRVDALQQDRASLQTHRVDRQRRKLKRLEAEYERLGGLLFEQRTEIERNLSAAENIVAEGAEALRELAAGPLPMLLVRDLLQSAADRDQREEDSRRARELFDVLRARDEEVLVRLRSEFVNERSISVLEQFFEADRGHWWTQGQRESELSLLPNVRSDLQGLLQSGFDQLLASSAQQLAAQEKAVQRVRNAMAESNSVPASDTIAGIAAERETAKTDLAALEVQYAGMGEEIVRLVREIERKEQLLTGLIRDEAADRNRVDDRERILRHVDRVRSTLGEFRRAVISRHVRRIEQLVFESYQQLLRKDSLIAGLSIDPDSFAITIFARDGSALNPDRLSAGERQLLGVSLLWGLAKASGRPLPTAIDTPLGRLDTTHRMNLVERYFPFASHQMLLFSTDEEITGEYLERLRPWIGRSYTLSYDDGAESTQIVPGYFESNEGVQ